jgi:thiol-disulfide isomerase/thioredoxin
MTSLSSKLAAIALLALALVASACSRTHSVVEDTGSASSAKAALSSVKELKDYDVAMLDAPATKLSQLIGKNKVLALNFWATWCGPCRQEIPLLNELQEEYRAQGVELIGLTVEHPARDTDKVRTFAKEFAINYQIGFSSEEMFMAFNSDPRMPIPQTFIFNREGKLVHHIKGLNPRTMRETLKAGIEKALKTTS